MVPDFDALDRGIDAQGGPRCKGILILRSVCASIVHLKNAADTNDGGGDGDGHNNDEDDNNN